MGNCCGGGSNQIGTRGTLIPTMMDNIKGNVAKMGESFQVKKPRNEPVLPTLLERTVTNEEERLLFEDHIADTDGEFYLSLFKPLLFFEIAAYECPKASSALCKLYANLYITPNVEDLVNGPLAHVFDDFMDDNNAKPESFSALKAELDKLISLKYLLGYKRHHLRTATDIGSSSDANQELDIKRKSQKIFTGTGKRSQMRASASLVSNMTDVFEDDDSAYSHPEPARTINPMAADVEHQW